MRYFVRVRSGLSKRFSKQIAGIFDQFGLASYFVAININKGVCIRDNRTYIYIYEVTKYIYKVVVLAGVLIVKSLRSWSIEAHRSNEGAANGR